MAPSVPWLGKHFRRRFPSLPAGSIYLKQAQDIDSKEKLDPQARPLYRKAQTIFRSLKNICSDLNDAVEVNLSLIVP